MANWFTNLFSGKKETSKEHHTSQKSDFIVYDPKLDNKDYDSFNDSASYFTNLLKTDAINEVKAEKPENAVGIADEPVAVAAPKKTAKKAAAKKSVKATVETKPKKAKSTSKKKAQA